MQGGYLMIDLSDTRLFERLRIGMQVGKPILIQDGNQNFFIDRITGGNPIYDEDDILTGYSDIVLLSANGSIIITDANVVTKTDLDNVINPLMENIKDASGNLRFIETNGTASTKEGLTITYNKCSLSGTHIMFVVAGSVDNGTAIVSNDIRCKFDLPDWILNKIYAVWSTNRVDIKSFPLIADDWSTQSLQVVLTKLNNGVEIGNSANVTLTADRNFRIQFDLLIDNESGE